MAMTSVTSVCNTSDAGILGKNGTKPGSTYLGKYFREVGIWQFNKRTKAATREKLWCLEMQRTTAELLSQGPDEKVSPGEEMVQ